MRRRLVIPVVMFMVGGLAVALPTSAAVAKDPGSNPSERAGKAADQLVDRPESIADLHRSPHDKLTRGRVSSGTKGLQYVTYERTYRGLPVVGGDLVVTTDSAGKVLNTAVAQKVTLNLDTKASVSTDAALATAKATLATVTGAGTPRLVVLALTGSPTLAWETTVAGTRAGNVPSRQHVFVSATTGGVVHAYDEIQPATGNGFYNGTVDITTSRAGGSFTLTDTTRPGLTCTTAAGATFTKATDTWGNATGGDLETACVDAMYAAQQQGNMLNSWYQRRGIDGAGSYFPIRVGLDAVNAFWDSAVRETSFGRSSDGLRQATEMDVVAHELGHGIFQFSPGGVAMTSEAAALSEGAGDIFGALTTAFAGNRNDPLDYAVGTRTNFFGQGAERTMYDPSLRYDAPNCYWDGIPNIETHSAAGPLDHWFYLAAEGTSPTNGQPSSRTCNGGVIDGIGIRAAGEIFYNALNSKTSTWTYRDVRTATLAAAKNLANGSCRTFNTIRAAWNSVSVPAQAGEPVCAEIPKCSGSNANRLDIPDGGATLSSTITISGCPAAKGVAYSEVTVHATHPYRGDLGMTLVSPDNVQYIVKSTNGSDGEDDVDLHLTFDLSQRSPNGTWTLQVKDVFAGDTGTLDGWSIVLG